MTLKLRMTTERAFTLFELLVSISMFGVIGLSFLSFLSSAAHTTAIENRASLSAQELKNGLEAMSTELRMSSAISPYIVGTSSASVTCSSALAVTSTTVKFMVVHDDASATTTAGIRPYYVGYRYDSSTKQLLRGEIVGSTISACTIPAGDPTNVATAKVIAENVVQIDSDGNGTVDPAFATSGNSIVVSLGILASGRDGTSITQDMPLSIYRRTP